MSENPSRTSPQTDKENTPFTSLIKTLGLRARFYPDGVDHGIPYAVALVEKLVPWHPEEMTRLRGETFTRRDLTNLIATTSLSKYANRESQKELSKPKQAECRVADIILEGDEPLTQRELQILLRGLKPNLDGLKEAYKKKVGGDFGKL